MEQDNIDSTSARKRQKVGEMEGSSVNKKVWRGDGGCREFGQGATADNSYVEYPRKGCINDTYSSAQKHSYQRESNDRYYNRDGYPGGGSADANSWKTRDPSLYYDEYGASSSYNHVPNWNSTSGNTGGRYRDSYAPDPFFAAGGFGRSNSRPEAYGHGSAGGGVYRSSSMERLDVPAPSSSGYYHTVNYSTAPRYNYEPYESSYHDRFVDRDYGGDAATPTAASRYNNAGGRGASGARFGFANSFRAGNAINYGAANGKYATNFKTRQYSFGAKNANTFKPVNKNAANKKGGIGVGTSEAEEKEPEKPKLITDASVKDLLVLRTNLLDFHVTMALLKLGLRPDLELRQSLIANTIAAPPAVVVAEVAKEMPPVVESAPSLVRTNSSVDTRNKPGVLSGSAGLARSSSQNLASAALTTPQLKRTGSVQSSRGDINLTSATPAQSGGREDMAKPALVRRDSSFQEKPVPNRFDSHDPSTMKTPVSGLKESTAAGPSLMLRQASRERSVPRSASRSRGFGVDPTTAAPAAADAREASASYDRDRTATGAVRANSRDRPPASTGYVRGRSRDPQDYRGYDYPPHQQGGYYDYPGYAAAPADQYGDGYGDRYDGYDAGYAYGGYDNRQYGYSAGGGGGNSAGFGGGGGGGVGPGGYGAGYDQARRDRSRGRAPAEYGNYNRNDSTNAFGRTASGSKPVGVVPSERSGGVKPLGVGQNEVLTRQNSAGSAQGPPQ